jgi:hypothetical protein
VASKDRRVKLKAWCKDVSLVSSCGGLWVFVCPTVRGCTAVEERDRHCDT